MKICSCAIKRNDYVQQGEGRRSHLLPSKLLWVTNRPLGNGWLLMDMRDYPSQSAIFWTDHHKTDLENKHSQCDLLPSGSCFGIPQYWFNCYRNSDESLWHFFNLMCSICYIVLKVHWIYLPSLVLYLSFINCLLFPVYEAACESKTIFPVTQ